MQKRMAWAQENSWEALMMFAPAVLLATVLHANPNTMNLLAGGFVAARLVYLWCYAKDLATARSSIWLCGCAVCGRFVCVCCNGLIGGFCRLNHGLHGAMDAPI